MQVLPLILSSVIRLYLPLSCLSSFIFDTACCCRGIKKKMGFHIFLIVQKTKISKLTNICFPPYWQVFLVRAEAGYRAPLLSEYDLKKRDALLHWVTSAFVTGKIGTVVYFESFPHKLSCRSKESLVQPMCITLQPKIVHKECTFIYVWIRLPECSCDQTG